MLATLRASCPGCSDVALIPLGGMRTKNEADRQVLVPVLGTDDAEAEHEVGDVAAGSRATPRKLGLGVARLRATGSRMQALSSASIVGRVQLCQRC